MLSQMREYRKLEPTDVRVIGRRVQDGLESQLMVIQTPFGYRRVAVGGMVPLKTPEILDSLRAVAHSVAASVVKRVRGRKAAEKLYRL